MKRVAKTSVKPAIPRGDASPATISAREFFARDCSTPDAQNALILKCVKETTISRGTIVSHVRYGVPVSVATANRLAEWNPEISAAKTLGAKS